MATRPKGMRIAELSRRSGTTKETIHFYLREGLLRRPKKTSRNMAYYDESHVEQLELIKRLRTESYLPLQVIKKVLDEGKLAKSARQLDLSGELFGQGARAQFEPIPSADLAERTGVSADRIGELEAAGLLEPSKDGRTKRYGYEDLKIVEIVRDAQKEAGDGAESLVLERFQIFERHMQALVRDEVAHFFSRVLTEGDPKRAVDLLRGGRETLGRYLAVSRARRLRQEVDAILPGLEADTTSPREPVLFPLPPSLAAELGEPERRAALEAARAERPRDVDAAAELLEHLVLVGDGEAAIAVHASLTPKIKAETRVALSNAEALILEERFDDAFTFLERLREDHESPYVDALWGTILLVRVRTDFAKLEPSTELMGFLSRAFNAYERARTNVGDDALARARTRLLVGRICLAAPEFLGVHEQGRADLRACLEALDHLGRAIDDGHPLRFGPLVRLELNALRFLRAGTDDPEERRRLERREAALRT